MPVLNSTTVLIEVKSTASTLRKAESTSRGMSDISTTAGLPECYMLTKDEACLNKTDIECDLIHLPFYIRLSLHGLRSDYCRMCGRNYFTQKVCTITDDTICRPCPEGSYINEDHHLRCECESMPSTSTDISTSPPTPKYSNDQISKVPVLIE